MGTLLTSAIVNKSILNIPKRTEGTYPRKTINNISRFLDGLTDQVVGDKLQTATYLKSFSCY